MQDNATVLEYFLKFNRVGLVAAVLGLSNIIMPIVLTNLTDGRHVHVPPFYGQC